MGLQSHSCELALDRPFTPPPAPSHSGLSSPGPPIQTEAWPRRFPLILPLPSHLLSTSCVPGTMLDAGDRHSTWPSPGLPAGCYDDSCLSEAEAEVAPGLEPREGLCLGKPGKVAALAGVLEGVPSTVTRPPPSRVTLRVGGPSHSRGRTSSCVGGSSRRGPQVIRAGTPPDISLIHSFLPSFVHVTHSFLPSFPHVHGPPVIGGGEVMVTYTR